MIRDLLPTERADFTALMYDAFKDDPLFRRVFNSDNAARNKHTARRFLSALFDMNIYLGGQPRGVFAGEKLLGCLLLEPVAASPVAHVFQSIKSLLRFVPVLVSMPPGAGRFMNTYARLTKAAAPKAPHTYLTMIGVAPNAQGRGVGRQLIDAAIQITAQSPVATGIALDTENENNVALYQKWGFALRAKVVIDGMPAYCMFRLKPAART